MKCILCEQASFDVLLSKDTAAEEISLREEFVAARARAHDLKQLKDVWVFAHAEPADVLACRNCQLLLRSNGRDSEREDYQRYAFERYDDAQMERLLAQYIDAFRSAETPYRQLLPPEAMVLEIGSYVGAFLHVAGEWGWRAVGIDIGRDVSRFANSKGYETLCMPANRVPIADNALDGVFVWNCFEQIYEPRPVMKEVHRILKPGGLCVIRTPNATFFRTCEALLNIDRSRGETVDADNVIVRIMAYNHLLAFPYRYGYSARNLHRLTEGYGLRPSQTLDALANASLTPHPPGWAVEEKESVMKNLEELVATLGQENAEIHMAPWLEVITVKA